MLHYRIGHVESSTRLLWQYYIDTKIMRNVKVHTSSPTTTTTTTTMIMIRTIFNGYNYGNIPVRTIQMGSCWDTCRRGNCNVCKDNKEGQRSCRNVNNRTHGHASIAKKVKQVGHKVGWGGGDARV